MTGACFIGFFLIVGMTLYCLGDLFIKGVLSGIPRMDRSKDAEQNQAEDKEGNNAGQIIGWFERSLYLVGIYIGEWSIFAVVAAFKTIARYKILDEHKIKAEYFLVGSLASLIWAVACALLYKLLLLKLPCLVTIKEVLVMLK